jgi:hypothetical protein
MQYRVSGPDGEIADIEFHRGTELKYIKIPEVVYSAAAHTCGIEHVGI